MRVGQCRNLRQMGNAEDLVGGGDLFEFFPDDLGNAAADTGIDFIEEQGRTPTRV